MRLDCNPAKVVKVLFQVNQVPHIHQLAADDNQPQKDEDFHSDPFL